MAEFDDPVTELDDASSRELLARHAFGRLAVAAGGEPEIFPVNYHFDGDDLLLRTAPGTKLAALTVNARVALETDGFDAANTAWSIVVKGTARELDRQSEIDAAERRPLRPWIPTLKYRFVVITPTAISGRRYALGDEPER